MTTVTAVLVCLYLVVGTGVALAAEDTPLPTPHESLLGEVGLDVFRLNNYGGDATRATLTAVEVAGQPFDKAVQISSTRRSDFWHVALTTGNFPAVRRGEVMLLRFWARTISSEQEDGNGAITAFVQQNERPFNPSLMETVTFGGQWTRVDLPFVVQQNYPADGDQLTLGLGAAKQTVQVGGIELLRMPAGTALTDLPVYRITYPGRALDAPWRAAAEQRIEEIRKAPLAVTVRDAAGQPVAGAQVRVQQLRHAYTFGTAVSAEFLPRDGMDALRYREAITTYFNTASIENGLKWARWEDPAKRPDTLATVKWLNDKGLDIHGHVLVWPSWDKSRVDLTAERAAAEAGDLEPLRQRIATHIRDILTATAGTISHWDVINETWNNHEFMDLLGRDAMVEWFKLARQYAPDTDLFINDFGILTVGDKETDGHQDHYFEEITYLLEQGAELDAIGMQGHFGSGGLTPPDRLLRILDRFATFGKPIYITEFDLMTQDELLQADFTRDVMTAVFSHPATEGFIFWGIWDKQHWRGNGAMFRPDWSLKPAGETIARLLKETWWTDETLTTDAEGKVAVRGFLGDYVVTVSAAGGTTEQAVTLTRDGASVQWPAASAKSP